jgi:hypothetical protein
MKWNEQIEDPYYPAGSWAVDFEIYVRENLKRRHPIRESAT